MPIAKSPMDAVRAAYLDIAKNTEEQEGAGKPQTFKDLCASIPSSEHIRDSLVPILHLLKLRGKPYSIADRFAMAPIFNTVMPRRFLFKTARQVSKTTSIAAQGVLQSMLSPYFSTLFVTPLYEQIRRFSYNYVRPFIEGDFTIKRIMMDRHCYNTVLQKTFANQSNMFFSFAYLDCERIRGISCDKLAIDEVQSMDFDFLPVIRACMSASPWKLNQYSGTPLTFDNTIEALWQKSSQAEWNIPCGHCKKINVPNSDHDVMKMIGKKTIVCAKCDRSLNPYAGYWVHAYPERRVRFSGYHVPQIIMPMHYAHQSAWDDLLYSVENDPEAQVMNELLGESCDVGHKLLTISDIQKASRLHKNTIEAAKKVLDNYVYRVLAVDWGGHGQKEISYTTAAVVGLTPQGKIHCIYAERLRRTLGDIDEAKYLLNYMRVFKCHMFAHDAGGAGSVKEALMIKTGLGLDRVMPIIYVRATMQKILAVHPPNESTARFYYSLDKARSLLLQVLLIKSGDVLLPEYESAQSLTDDLLALIEDKIPSPRGSDVYLVSRNPKVPDDFAHSLNFGSVAIYHVQQRWPDLANIIPGFSPTDLTIAAAQHAWSDYGS